MAEHDGAEHDFLGQLVRLGLDHQHAVAGAGDDQVEVAFFFVDQRVQHVFAVLVGDAGGADRTHEGQAGNRQGGRGADQRHDVGVVLHVVAQHGADDLRLVAEAVDEQRADRPVDQAADQRLLLGRPGFAALAPTTVQSTVVSPYVAMTAPSA